VETIKYSVLSTILKTRLIILLFILAVSTALFSQISIESQSGYKLEINRSNLIVFKIRNNSDKNISFKINPELPEGLVSLTQNETLEIKGKSTLICSLPLYPSSSKLKQKLILPVRFTDASDKQISIDYLNLSLNPYTNFNVTLEAVSRYAVKDREYLVRANLSNESNVPCFGTLTNRDYRIKEDFQLMEGENKAVMLHIKGLNLEHAILPLTIEADYRFVFEDSLQSGHKSFSQILDFVPLWESDHSNFIKIPSYLAIKSTRDYKKTDHWNYEITTSSYTEISSDKSLDWFVRKKDGAVLKNWTDEDEYRFNFQYKYIKSSLGKQNYNFSPLLGNIYATGMQLEIFPSHYYLSLSKIKDQYRDRLNMLGFSTGYLLKPSSINVQKDNALLFNYQKKYRNFSLSGSSGSADSLNNQKASILMSLNINEALLIKSEYLQFKNSQDKSWFDKSGIISNEIQIKNESTSFRLLGRFQNDPIKGEYLHNKVVESSLFHNFQDNFMLNASMRFQDSKSDYNWTYRFNQINQSYFIKSRFKLYSPLYGVSEINYSQFTSTRHDYNSRDNTNLYGIALMDKNFYGEIMKGKRDFNYFDSNENEEIWKFNIRYFFMDKLYLISESRLKKNKSYKEVSAFLSGEYRAGEKTSILLSTEHNHYSSDTWKDVMIYNAEYRYEIKKDHAITASFKAYDYINSLNQSNYSISMEYSIPLDFPVFPRFRKQGIVVRVKDPFLQKPVSNALIKANNYYGFTDASGKAEFLGINQDKYNIEIVNMPESYLNNQPMPVSSVVNKNEIRNVDLQLVKPASITVNVKMLIPKAVSQEDLRGNDSLRIFDNRLVVAGNKQLVKPEYPVSIIIQNKDQKLIKQTDSEGKVEFSNLLPGQWTISVDKSSLPGRFSTETENIRINVLPGSDNIRNIQLSPILFNFDNFQKGEMIIK